VKKILNCCKVNKVWLSAEAYLPVAAIIFLFVTAGCKQKQQPGTIERAFYYWKSKLSFTSVEADALQQLHITKLYVKLFDADWDDEQQRIQPVARIDVDSAAIKITEQLKIELIPVVFITNESLHKIDSAGTIDLANKIVKLTGIIQQKEKLKSFREFQLDCDWTATTKTKYFLLVDEVKKLIAQDKSAFTADAKLSATIRLHQIKFSGKTGVPKVDKGLLMCYNMGNLKSPSAKNSIIETEEMKKYLSSLQNYPLPLDIALPLFSWHVIFSNHTYKGISSNFDIDQLSSVLQQTSNYYTFLKDTVVNEISFAKGDIVRKEESSKEELTKAINYLQQQLSPANRNFTVSFYHLDELILNKHPQHELEIFYNSFR
jgi:hypothetical protein